jgi:hypothetical protein
MQLEFALFCEAAEVSNMGMIDMLRGGYDIIFTSGFPAVLGRMLLVVRVVCEPSEINVEHALVSQMIDPKGHVLSPNLTSTFTTPPYPGSPNRKNRSTLKFDYWSIQFVEPGDYTFRFLADGVEIGETKLEIRLREKKA